MTVSINNRNYVGFSYLAITRKKDGVLLNLPAPQTFVLTPNYMQRVQETRNSLGRATRADNYIRGEMGELSISFQYLQPELIAFSLGQDMETGTFATYFPVLTTAKASIPGGAAGTILEGITADDANTTASYTVDGISTELTRQAFGTFDGTSPTNDNNFAVGADGALLFSDVLLGAVSIEAGLISSDGNRVDIFRASNAKPNVEGQTFDFGGEGTTNINLFLNNQPGECTAWELIISGKNVTC